MAEKNIDTEIWSEFTALKSLLYKHITVSYSVVLWNLIYTYGICDMEKNSMHLLIKAFLWQNVSVINLICFSKFPWAALYSLSLECIDYQSHLITFNYCNTAAYFYILYRNVSRFSLYRYYFYILWFTNFFLSLFTDSTA